MTTTSEQHDPCAVHDYERLENPPGVGTGAGHVTIWYGAGKWWNFARHISIEDARSITRAYAIEQGMLPEAQS